jgi:hypothetical protein
MKGRLVSQIIHSPLNDKSKLALLRPFVRVGQSVEEVDRNLGPVRAVTGHGPGFFDRSYEIGLEVSFYPDGEAFAIGYHASDGQYVGLAFDEPVTWPKTKK